MSRNPAGDFDFLIGSWSVLNHRLRERLAGCQDWDTFTLRYDYLPLLAGQANVDRIYGDIEGEYFEGMSVRCYDPAQREWVIYWADIYRPLIVENVRGGFDGDVGTFYGSEQLGDRSCRLRFLWTKISADAARWEQAFQDPETDQWETNWIMEFERLSGQADWRAHP